MKIAIIGSGIAAATLCYRVSTACSDVSFEIFEKSRGVGGRMSTRRREHWAFDHGVPFFTARTESFQQTLKAFQSDGVVDIWQPNVTTLGKGKKPYKRDWFEPHYVASPGMNQLCKALLGAQSIEFEQTINLIEGKPAGWYLQSTRGGKFGPFDLVVSTAPAAQTQVIFQNVADAPSVDFDPCFTLLVKCSQNYQPEFDAARVNESTFKWLTWSQQKPGRLSYPSLVGHGTGEYSRSRFDEDHDRVKEELLNELRALLPTAIPVEDVDLHRWKYAQVVEPLGQPYWMDTTHSLAACGDWCLGNEVEHAYLSADALATEIIGQHTI